MVNPKQKAARRPRSRATPKTAKPARAGQTAGRTQRKHTPPAKKKTAPRRRRNPPSATEMFRTFHGREPRRITEVETEELYPVDVADCGRLLQLDVLDDDGERVTPLESKGNVRVWTTPEGGQLYFHGGDQALDLARLGLDHVLPKDHVEIGPVHTIHYRTTKDFHDFEPMHYFHEFGEEGGELPVLNYDTRNKRLYLTGGTYQVKREGIVN